MVEPYDIAIIGGGMIGIALASALAQANFSVVVIESQQPCLHWQASDYDARVSAVHLGTQRFLENLGVWSLLNTACYSPLERMDVWDAQGNGCIQFDAADIDKDVLGYIVENREIVRVLWQQCEANNKITLLSNVKPTAIDHHKITVTNGETINATLMVGADGAHSWLRQQMNIDCMEKPYHHQAIVAVVATEKPHFYTAYQSFLSSGPLGVLPLSDAHQVAIVWSTEPAHAEQLLAMPLKAFDYELMNTLQMKLGKMHCLSQRKAIPLVQRHAKNYVQENKILVGDAAHTIHPLAGQGANLGFMDVACLAQVLASAKKANKNWQSTKILRRYERRRKSENEMMLLTMNAFKSIFSSHSPVVMNLRSWGFNLTDRVKFLKHCFMRYAVYEN